MRRQGATESTCELKLPCITEKVRGWAMTDGLKFVHVYIDSQLLPVRSMSYAELEGKTNRLAAWLEQEALSWKDTKQGERPCALLCYPPGLEFIEALYGCLKSPVIAVPVFSPDLRQSLSTALTDNLRSIAMSCSATVSLTTTAYRRLVRLRTDGLGLTWISTDVSCLRESSSDVGSPLFKPSAICFLQYTSGSTSAPKGVMISHGNLAHNLFEIAKAVNSNEATVCVSWLPHQHDMGLIGSYLGTAYCGGRGYHMSPIDFVRRPSSWVEAMAKFHATHTQAPSFAYGLAARKFLTSTRTADAPDLSLVEHAINAAEPIRGSDIDAFLAAFPTFPKAAMRPTYGLAEHTVFVCSNGTKRVDFDSDALERDGVAVVAGDPGCVPRTLFGCGAPPSSIALRIVRRPIGDSDEAATARVAVEADGIVGEIWLRSLSRAMGYYGVDDGCFAGDLAGEGGGWLRTGDLGFIYEGEVFVCGRCKDLIIVRGRNHYPQDIEKTAEDASQGCFRPGCSAAVPYGDGHGVQLVVEAKMSCDRAHARIVAEAVSRNHGFRLARLIVAAPRTIPKTTSGKISRRKTKLKLDAGEIPVVATYLDDDRNADVGPAAAMTAAPLQKACCVEEIDDAALSTELAKLAAKVGKHEAIDPNLPLASLGLDSMEGMHLLAEVEERFGVAVDPELLLDSHFTLEHLAFVVRRRGDVCQPIALDVRGVADDLLRTSSHSMLDRRNTVARADIITRRFAKAEWLQPAKYNAPTPARALWRAALSLQRRTFIVALAALALFVALVPRSSATVLIILIPLVAGVPRRVVAAALLRCADPKFSRRLVAELTPANARLVVLDRSKLRKQDRPTILALVAPHPAELGVYIALAIIRDLVLPTAAFACAGTPLVARFALHSTLFDYSQPKVAEELFAKRSLIVLLPHAADLNRLATIAASTGAKLVPALATGSCAAVAAPLLNTDPAILHAEALDTLCDLRSHIFNGDESLVHDLF